MRRHVHLGVAAVLGLAGVALLAAAIPGAQARVGRGRPAAGPSSSVPANGASFAAAISADGRFVAFLSYASNLVAGDTNHTGDVFVLDRVTGTTERVNVSSAGTQANSYSGDGLAPVAISADGRFVAFDSDAWNLVASDTNNRQGLGGESCPDVFVRDRATGTSERVNVSSSGKQASSKYPFEFCSGGPSISADGRFVAFWSEAANLVARDTNTCNGDDFCSDVFVRDRVSGKTTRVNVSSAGKQANDFSGDGVISADGRFVAFSSSASNLVAGDTNKTSDVFLRDRVTGKTTRVSVSSAGKQANGDSGPPTISPDGRFVAFSSSASNLVAGDTNKTSDVFLRDRAIGKTTRVSVSSAGKQADTGSGGPSISADGRFVAFISWASNLVAGDTNRCVELDPHGGGGALSRYPCPDVFVDDRATGTTERVSVSSAGTQANKGSGEADLETEISADGRFVAFSSSASNLVAGDTNKTSDVFLRDRETDTTTMSSVGR